MCNQVKRRGYLGAVAAGFTALAGCSTGDTSPSGEQNQTDTPATSTGDATGNVQGGVSVSCSRDDPGSVTITFTDGPAEKIKVTTFEVNGTDETSSGTGNLPQEELTEVDESITYTEDDGTVASSETDQDTTVKWAVTAISGDRSTILSENTCEI